MPVICWSSSNIILPIQDLCCVLFIGDGFLIKGTKTFSDELFVVLLISSCIGLWVSSLERFLKTQWVDFLRTNSQRRREGFGGESGVSVCSGFSRLVASWARCLWAFISSNSRCISSMEDRGGLVVPESGVFFTVSDSLFPEELPLTTAEVARRGAIVSSGCY